MDLFTQFFRALSLAHPNRAYPSGRISRDLVPHVFIKLDNKAIRKILVLHASPDGYEHW